MASAWIEIFKTGTHTSGNGVTKTYTENDLDQIVKRYNEQKDHEAPLVLGHPATDSPAYGWAKELKRAGVKLLAFVDQVTDKIVESVNRGDYKKVSIAIYPDGLLRHIGLLGAMPPAVKGLAPVQFSEDLTFDEYIWATDETRMPIVGRILSGVRDFFIEKFGVEATNKIIDKDDIAYLQRPAEENMIAVPPVQTPGANYSEIHKQEEIDMNEQELEKKFTDLETKLLDKVGVMFQEKITSFTTGFNELKTLLTNQISNSEKIVKETAKETAKTAFAAFCETLAKDGKILPAEKDGLIDEYADLLNYEESMTFSEGDVKPSNKMKDRLSKRPVIVSRGKTFADPNKSKIHNTDQAPVPDKFAEIAHQVDPASVELDAQIKAYAEKHNLSYEQAADQFVTA